MGLISSVIVQGKLLIQQLWLANLGWDEQVPKNIFNIWLDVQAPNAKKLQLHGFCDASMRAYGACVYIRSENAEGQVKV